jgi:hypothetical protein
MPTHISYPSIEQFRNAIRNVSQKARYAGKDSNGDSVYDNLKPLPILTFHGGVKLHGTNFAIGLNRTTNEVWFQSRENIITPEKDNAGSATYFHNKNLSTLFHPLPGNEILIYGEWCGGNIQKGVALNKLPKMMVIFDILIDGEWQPKEVVSQIKDSSIQAFNIYDYPTWEIEIDFNRPEESQNKLVELTTKVADHCPVGLAFGSDGIGEGIVWKCITEGYANPKFSFKVKDERHANSPVKTLNPVDSEKISQLRVLAEKITPTWRLSQMMEKACDLNNGGAIDRAKIGEYLKLVNQDVIKEESDVIKEAGFEYKDVAKFVGDIAKKYFYQQENESVGLKN